MDKNSLIVTEENIPNNLDIKSMIYTIRGKQVMLDSDLAKIYGYDVKNLNRQVKNNINKFPSDFMFQLNVDDLDDSLRCKFFTLNSKGNRIGMHIKYMPYAFTEQGIYMLATVLKGELATKQTIYIIRSFRELRHMYIDNRAFLDKVINIEINQDNINNKLIDHDNKFNEIFNFIDNHKEVTQKIFYKGQIYDAYSLLIDLVLKANKEIILIDNYIDIKTLNILSKKNKNVVCSIYTTSKGNKLTKQDIDAFNNEYPLLLINNTNNFHDRFLILDKKIIYLIGASIKDAGKKTFCITQIDKTNIDKLIKELKS